MNHTQTLTPGALGSPVPFIFCLRYPVRSFNRAASMESGWFDSRHPSPCRTQNSVSVVYSSLQRHATPRVPAPAYIRSHLAAYVLRAASTPRRAAETLP